MERKSKDTDIDNIPAIKENTDACKIPAMGKKDMSTFAANNRSFRKCLKQREGKTAQVKTITGSYDAVNSLHRSDKSF